MEEGGPAERARENPSWSLTVLQSPTWPETGPNSMDGHECLFEGL